MHGKSRFLEHAVTRLIAKISRLEAWQKKDQESNHSLNQVSIDGLRNHNKVVSLNAAEFGRLKLSVESVVAPKTTGPHFKPPAVTSKHQLSCPIIAHVLQSLALTCVMSHACFLFDDIVPQTIMLRYCSSTLSKTAERAQR